MPTMAGSLSKDSGNRYFEGPGGYFWRGTRDGTTDYATGDVRLVAADGKTPLITTNGLYVQGAVEHDAAVAANPIIIGGRASAAAPSAVSADGDATRLWVLRNGAAAVELTSAGALIPGDASTGLRVNVAQSSTDNNIGGVGDAAVTTDANGTLSAKLRGLVTQIGAVTASPVANTVQDRLKSLLAKLPALGTAGTASSDVISVQGIASGTAMNLISGQNGVAGNQGGVGATTQRVVLANDVALPAGSAHIGQVGGESAYIISTPTLSVAGAYASGDYIGPSTTPASLASVTRSSAFRAILKSLVITDKQTAAAVAMELWLFSATFTAPTDNAAWAISDSDQLNCVGVVPITTDRWFANSNGKVYSDDSLGLMVSTGASTTLYYALVARGTTPTWSSGDLQLNFGFVAD